jgi:hypothetical protein
MSARSEPRADETAAISEAKDAAWHTAVPSGRDLVAALRNSPLADVTIERWSIRAPVRDVDLPA